MALYAMSVEEILITLLWHVCGANNNIPMKSTVNYLRYTRLVHSYRLAIL